MLNPSAILDKVYRSRKLPARFDGEIHTFDLDKTYLATEFETLSGLVRIPFESAEEKQNIPGAAALVREIRRGPKQDEGPTPLYFISGSPSQMEGVIREKFKLDGVTFDGILFKDFTSALKRFKFRMIIDKIGYKLNALLYARSTFPRKADEVLYGDDSEYDATIYSLYSDILAGRLEDFEVLTILKRWQIDRGELEKIRKSLTRLRQSGWKSRDAVKRIFIHLETGSSPADYLTLTQKVTPTKNYFQTAILLYQMQQISRAGLFRVISELLRVYKFRMIDFLASTEDLLSRRLIDRREAKKLLKIISKGNPLALPLQWLADMRDQFSGIIEEVNMMPPQLAGTNRKDKERPALDLYLKYTPKRRV